MYSCTSICCVHERSSNAGQKSMNLELIWPCHRQVHRMWRTSEPIKTQVVLYLYIIIHIYIHIISNVNHMFLFWFWHHICLPIILRWMDLDGRWSNTIWDETIPCRVHQSPLTCTFQECCSPNKQLDGPRTAERWLFETHVPHDDQDADKSGSISKLELVAAMQSIWAICRLGMELEIVAN